MTFLILMLLVIGFLVGVLGLVRYYGKEEMRQTIEVISCDRCTTETEESTSFGIDVERYCDDSGNTSTRTLSFDLCTECQTKLLSGYFRDAELNPEAIMKIKKMVPRAKMYD